MLRAKNIFLFVAILISASNAATAEVLQFNCNRSVALYDGLSGTTWGSVAVPFSFTLLNINPGPAPLPISFPEFNGLMIIGISGGQVEISLSGDHDSSAISQDARVAATSHVRMSVAGLSSGFKIESQSLEYIPGSSPASRLAKYNVNCSRVRSQIRTSN